MRACANSGGSHVATSSRRRFRDDPRPPGRIAAGKTRRTTRRGDPDRGCRPAAPLRRTAAVGARHSFNDIADSPGELIDLRDIEPGFVIDREHATVTVSAAAN